MTLRTILVSGFSLLFGLMLSRASFADIQNSGFESDLKGWRALWTRDAGAGELSLDSAAHSGKGSARISHRGEKDWSFEPSARVPVTAGEVFELTGWLKIAAAGGAEATLCVATYEGGGGRAIDWSYGARSMGNSSQWRQLRSRFVIPEGVSEIQPRIIGHGRATVWLDDFSLARMESVDFSQRRTLLNSYTISNGFLNVTLNSSNATLTVLDRRTNRTTEQKPARREIVLLEAIATGDAITMKLLHAESGLVISGAVQMETNEAEFTVQLNADGELPGALSFPHPFATAAGDYLVVPMNEGISYPVEDRSIEPMRLIAYGGHGICMAFWGVTDGGAGHAAIIESPDDAAIRIDRWEGLLAIAPEWDAQRGQFGYPRKLRYVFFEDGGHVRIAKRYREYARQTGLLKTLAEKRAENPNVDLLIGAVNVWCWDRDAVSIVREMRAAGIERILWSNRQSPENLRQLNEMGVLTSRYDIYQDSMDPEKFPLLRWIHPDWTTRGWPNDIILDGRGDWRRGWGVEGKDGKLHPCGVLCDARALDYARERIPAELAASPYRSRFIDTTTAAPWNECFHTNHPMTRTESKRFKMELLQYVSRDSKLVTGCETGHDAAVPFLHYFEGMLSLGPYRVPDSGRDMARIWTNAPEQVVKFQLGHEYRLPLWELVYHDCVVSQWYWGDYNNKLPMLWDKRDLFNLLYGTPPMFMFNRDLWAKERARFVQSYKSTCLTAREAGYSEMTDHRFLTPNRRVQQTRFANGAIVTVNFGDDDFLWPDGRRLAARGFDVSKGNPATKQPAR